MKTLLIIPSIRILKHWKSFEQNAINHNFNLNNLEVIIIDEENSEIRDENNEILSEITHKFYGEFERNDWFERLGLESYKDLIPKNSHAETSFGLLWAYYHNRFENIIFLDDDVAPGLDDFFGGHINQLNSSKTDMIISKNKWYNFIPRFYGILNTYPRGFPYSQREQNDANLVSNVDSKIIINQGLWYGQLDLNAVDILPNLNGLTETTKDTKTHRNIILHNNYITVCSMNLSFKPEIIPAFYQLPMGEKNVDRFDDIWSGIIITKIINHLNKSISTGAPFCNHKKEPRSTFRDIILEAHGLEINERLWKLIDNIQLNRKTYYDCYYEIFNILDKSNDKYFIFLSNKMIRWLDCCKKIEEIR